MPQYEELGLKGVIVKHGIPQWTVVNDSGNNANLTLTKAGSSGKMHYITAFEVVIQGAAAANDIIVELRNGATPLWRGVIGSGAPRGERTGAAFSNPIELSAGSAANLVVTSGGVGVIATANMAGYTQ